jgi:hypothetical protein
MWLQILTPHTKERMQEKGFWEQVPEGPGWTSEGGSNWKLTKQHSEKQIHDFY